MNGKSELEQFLKSRSAEGVTESHGQFTLDRDVALRKIAEFQLPYKGAWAVKIIQGLASGEVMSPIRVDLTATEIRFFFAGLDFTLDDLEQAFHSPETQPNRSLRHLLSGLWAVGLREKWGFQVALANEPTSVIWDGQQLHRVSSDVKRDCACLSIAPLQQRSSLSWVAGIAMSGSRNADILLALTRNCYLSPTPLTVDGRRVDTLQGSEHHGWTSKRSLISVGFAETSIPALRIPPGTFEGAPKSIRPTTIITTGDGGGWKRIGEKRMKRLTPREEAPVGYVLCVHMKQVTKGRSSVWEADTGPSRVYWSLDGVLVGEEALMTQSSHVSIGCFLNAEGLETDLSTLKLVQSPERLERVHKARKAILVSLDKVDDKGFDEMINHGTLVHRVIGGCIMAVGVGCMFVSPAHGLGLAVTGGVVVGTAGSKERQRVASTRQSLSELRHQLHRQAGVPH